VTFSNDVLAIDAEAEATRICEAIVSDLRGLHRRGAVVAMSGGIDSSVVVALCVRALGPAHVLGILLPERDSSSDALRLGRLLAGHLGIDHVVEDIAPALTAMGCYDRQVEAIRMVVPGYGPGWRCKIVMPSILAADRLNIPGLRVADPDGREGTVRLTGPAYLQLVAATNFKQRTRKTMEYYHADRLQFAVAGTPNLLEYDQAFFVKQGDGAADIKPIAHLYKTQVYELARHLGLPDEIQARPPTTDTFSLPQSQEEFYFALPYHQMDLCLWAYRHAIAPAEVARSADLTEDQVARVFRDIEAKRRVGVYLHHVPRPYPERS
jgi:NAD+ synthase